MKSFIYSLAVMSFASFSLVACGSESYADKCDSQCDDYADCEGVSASEVTACRNSCDQASDLVDASNCNDEADSYADCAGDVDVCSDDDISSDCDDEFDDLVDCYTKFCQDNPNNSACAIDN